jgi:hypothetical protein
VRGRLAASFFLLAAAGCGSGGGPATVENARVSLPAVAGRPGAAYFTLTGGDGADALIAIESARAQRIEMHRSVRRGAAIAMEAVSEIPAGAGERRFEPGGDHAMVFGIDPAVRAGGTMPLLFRFRSGRTVMLQAEVVPPGGGHH